MLELCQVNKSYGPPSRAVVVLRNVSLSVKDGEVCALLGPSGSGKSTLMNLIGLLDRPSAGRVQIGGVDVSNLDQAEAAAVRNRMHGFIFQAFQLLPRLTAWENVALPLLYRGVAKAERRAPALALLELVGLQDRADHRPESLSGGQRQRVAVARALIGKPRLLLADEPTGSLDSGTASDVMDLFRSLNRALGVTIVMVTHDGRLAARCDRQVELLDGQIIADSGGADIK